MPANEKKRARERASSVLIFAPGLVRYPANSAGVVADVLAGTLDRQREGRYSAENSVETAPRGLRVGKTILGPSGEPLLEVFELDYRDRLDEMDAEGGRDTPPGILKAAWFSLKGLGLLISAARRPAKSGMAKVQLLLGLLATVALMASAVAAIIAGLAAMDLLAWVPDRLTDWFPYEVDASTVAVGGATGIALLWVKFRKVLLKLAEQTRKSLQYLDEPRYRDTVTHTLDDAIDGLLDGGWKCPIHVLGYSFGSLVAIDALFPKSGSLPEGDRLASAVSSLTTIGCPADAVRLYFPGYYPRALARVPDVPWTNVFNGADVFGSNFNDGTDLKPADSTLAFGGASPTSLRYTDERLSFGRVLRGLGFKTHCGYWDLPGRANCLGLVMDIWIPQGLGRGAKGDNLEPATPAN
ncbi:MAG TPA: hypothetical protein VHL54_01160 [Actinomycetota bacterium]|nr:hypothetical protein [Actinomycetota bacterium]